MGSEIELLKDVVVIAAPEADDLIGNRQQNGKVDQARYPLSKDVQLARALLLVMLMESAEGIVQLSAHLAGLIKIGEEFGKLGRARHQLTGSFAGSQSNLPTMHRASQCGSGARGSGTLPRTEDRAARAAQNLQ